MGLKRFLALLRFFCLRGMLLIFLESIGFEWFVKRKTRWDRKPSRSRERWS
ncbi:hypothetical protein Patl1_13744 [Pistacia atlantica]|uniref:Uncharacterized protein n=1 Tax=Pistacia atlantica TaxID=434234 RepID=A0ACC1ATW7_9ROSI|nr:hypothetical protein Patl1_13744 [Pistacia atlantica]